MQSIVFLINRKPSRHLNTFCSSCFEKKQLKITDVKNGSFFRSSAEMKVVLNNLLFYQPAAKASLSSDRMHKWK